MCNTNLLLTDLVVVTSILIVHFDIYILPNFLTPVGEERKLQLRKGDKPDFNSRFGG